MRFRGELEARIVELRHQIVDVVGRLLGLLPKHRGGSFVGIGDLDRFIERVGDGLEQGIFFLVCLVASNVICVSGPPNTLRGYR